MTTLFVDFVAGLTTDNPLASGGTSFTSPGLEDLVEVVAPDIVKVCFNPGAVGDPPEIAYVTAHTAASDTATILRGQEGTAGTEWAASTTWTTVLTADDVDDIRALGANTGDTKSGIWSAAPTGWLLMDGTAHADADDNYPDLWAIAPAAWKSGTTLTLPDMTEDRVLMGGGTVGAEGGANTHTLVTANLPAHSHTFSDTSTSSLTTHTHSFSATTSEDGDHNHSGEFTTHADPGAGGINFARRIADTGTTTTQIANTNGDHTHTVSGTTGASASLAHTHDVSGTTSETGSSTAVDHTPAHLRVNWAIKT